MAGEAAEWGRERHPHSCGCLGFSGLFYELLFTFEVFFVIPFTKYVLSSGGGLRMRTGGFIVYLERNFVFLKRKVAWGFVIYMLIIWLCWPNRVGGWSEALIPFQGGCIKLATSLIVTSGLPLRRLLRRLVGEVFFRPGIYW